MRLLKVHQFIVHRHIFVSLWYVSTPSVGLFGFQFWAGILRTLFYLNTEIFVYQTPYNMSDHFFNKTLEYMKLSVT